MASNTSARPKKSKAKPAAPFEEPLFVKYSPHHEFSLSTASSVALHVLVVGLLALGGWLIIKLGLTPNEDALPVDAIAIGGGGGSRTGVGDGPGVGGNPAEQAIDQDAPQETRPDVTPVQREQLKKVRHEALNLPEFKDDPEAQRLVEDGGRQVDSILALNRDTRSKLNQGLTAGKGRGGAGQGGGEGEGHGTGKGSGVGSGTGTLNDRTKRVLRWTLIFNTSNGQDYANQLAGLGAIIAIPDPKNPDNYLVIRDLRQRPVHPQPEDLAAIQRIYWIDDKPASVQSLASALGLPNVSHFVAFFPVELEQKLLRLELNFRGLKEDEIHETKFELRKTAGGYDPVVVSQR
jgi:hypothetical protein